MCESDQKFKHILYFTFCILLLHKIIYGIKLLHANTSSHKTKQVAAYLEDIGVKAPNRPPYSPDLSPCYFWLFSKLKNHLSGKEFTTRMEIGFAIHQT